MSQNSWTKQLKRVKPLGVLALLVFLFVLAGIVYASNPPCGGSHTYSCYEVPNQSSPSTTVDEWFNKWCVTNTTGLPVFIPTNTSGEWASVYNHQSTLPSGLTLAGCGASGGGGAFSVEYVTPCPNSGEFLTTAEDNAKILLQQAINDPASSWLPAEKTAATNALNSPGLIWQGTYTTHSLSGGGYTWTYATSYVQESDEYFKPPCLSWTTTIYYFGHVL